jgi:hypothetical protein
MKWLWLAVGGGLSLLLLPLAQQELYGWCWWLAERLVVRAVRCLPIDRRARYQEEWLG